MLHNYVVPFFQTNDAMVFQQDNARPHSAYYTRQVLAENHIATLEWPSRSPDSSPVKHVWDILWKRIYAQKWRHQRSATWGCIVEGMGQHYWRRATNLTTTWGNIVPLWYTKRLLYTISRPVWLLGCDLYLTLTFVTHYWESCRCLINLTIFVAVASIYTFIYWFSVVCLLKWSRLRFKPQLRNSFDLV